MIIMVVKPWIHAGVDSVYQDVINLGKKQHNDSRTLILLKIFHFTSGWYKFYWTVNQKPFQWSGRILIIVKQQDAESR